MTHLSPVSNGVTPTPPRFHVLVDAGRVVWLFAAAGLCYFYVQGLLVLLGQPFNLCIDPGQCDPVEAAAYIQSLGLNPAVVNALFFATLNLVMPLGCLGTALFLVWRGGRSALALAAATTLLFYGLFVGNNVVTIGLGASPWQAALRQGAILVFLAASFYMLHTFPNGRFVPRWGRLALLGEWLSLLVLAARGVLETAGAGGLYLLITLLGLGLQVYRYRRAASPTEQQQLKWGLTGILGLSLDSVLWTTWVLPTAGSGPASQQVTLMFLPVSTVLVLSLPVTLAIAVLRYRLWDIDVLIRRTLIYTGVTAVLTGTYFGLVVVLQTLTVAFTSRHSSTLVTVLSTLAIAALFAPLRRRVQDFVDRRFYRRKYDTAQTLAKFAQQARNEVDLDRLAAELRGAVTDAMQPSHVDLWLR
ncbi:MAG: hypothetical protein IT317_19705 [Anaerolineales bacterium]|nr:hypothetical protein [Anaerolineales bacterium]